MRLFGSQFSKVPQSSIDINKFIHTSEISSSLCCKGSGGHQPPLTHSLTCWRLKIQREAMTNRVTEGTLQHHYAIFNYCSGTNGITSGGHDTGNREGGNSRNCNRKPSFTKNQKMQKKKTRQKPDPSQNQVVHLVWNL